MGLLQDESGGCPPIGQTMPGMEATRAWSAAFTRNVGRPVPTLPPQQDRRVATGSAASGRDRKALSTVAGQAGGPARSSDETPVMRVEPRGRVARGGVRSINRTRVVWEESCGRAEVVSQAVCDFEVGSLGGVEKVKANKGAPGVDDCSIEDFGADLRSNLYRIWNRMSSGSYFPPAVLAVEIPKPHGQGTRVLGVPTEAA